MIIHNYKLFIVTFFFFVGTFSQAQSFLDKTKIKGFVHFEGSFDLDERKPSFYVGEQDLFITSQVTDKLDFLGESVIRYSSLDQNFHSSIERIILKYNYFRNHNVLGGKHHTPLNFWNDTYHHGRVFFPTIDRPLLFKKNIIPIHTTGISFQGQNLTDLRFGYDIMLGNGISTLDKTTNSNNNLATTIALHIKPFDGMRTGITAYYDKIDANAISTGHHSTGTVYESLDQQIYTAYFSYLNPKIEIIAEGSTVFNKGNISGINQANTFYAYLGKPIEKLKLITYVRYDLLLLEEDEVYFSSHDQEQIVIGLRHELNYKAVVKIEYQFYREQHVTDRNMIKVQIAIGF